MIPKNFENKEIGLLGLGVSGKSAFVSLEAGGGNIYAFDDKISDNPNILEPDKWPWEKLNKIVVSPGISLNHPVIKKAQNLNVDIINEIDIFANSSPKAKVIGVTGTNGKSTTSALLCHIINLNGFEYINDNINNKEKFFILVDPSYEIKEDFYEIYNLLNNIHSKFEKSKIIIWYPILNYLENDIFIDNIESEKCKEKIKERLQELSKKNLPTKFADWKDEGAGYLLKHINLRAKKS